MRFFGARSPSKIAYIGAKGAFRKILGSVGQKWISEKVSKGGPFGSAGGQIPEGEGVRPPPPPLNPPLLPITKWLELEDELCSNCPSDLLISEVVLKNCSPYLSCSIGYLSLPATCHFFLFLAFG